MLMTSREFGIGRKIPDFLLPDVISGRSLGRQDCLGEKATVLAFICNHCPYVQHLLPAFVTMAGHWHGPEFYFVALSANDATAYPQDSPERMRELALEMGFSFPYVFDEDQSFFKEVGVVCTPEFMVLDADAACLYHGRFDDTTPGAGAMSHGDDLRSVLEAIEQGLAIPQSMPSMGCSVKWK